MIKKLESMQGEDAQATEANSNYSFENSLDYNCLDELDAYGELIQYPRNHPN